MAVDQLEHYHDVAENLRDPGLMDEPDDDAICLPNEVQVIAAEDSDDEENTQAAGELDDETLADLLEIVAAQAEKDAAR